MKTVTVLMRDDCENGPRAVAHVKRLAEALGLAVQVDVVMVRTDDDARRERFLGSPTVRVAGRDVDVEARASTSYGQT